MEHLTAHQSTDVLEQTLSSLDSNEALVLRLRTGLIDGHQHTLREVGAFLGSTKAEARTLEWSGWCKLINLAQTSSNSSDVIQYLLMRRTRKLPTHLLS